MAGSMSGEQAKNDSTTTKALVSVGTIRKRKQARNLANANHSHYTELTPKTLFKLELRLILYRDSNKTKLYLFQTPQTNLQYSRVKLQQQKLLYSPYIMQTPVSWIKRKRLTLNNHTVKTVIINKNIMTRRNAVSIAWYLFSSSVAAFSLAMPSSIVFVSLIVETSTTNRHTFAVTDVFLLIDQVQFTSVIIGGRGTWDFGYSPSSIVLRMTAENSNKFVYQH